MPSMRALLIEQAVRSFMRPLLSVEPVPSQLLRVQAQVERWARLLPPVRDIERRSWRRGNLQGEWLQPKSLQGSGVILYLHGGAYILGSPASHRDLTATLAKQCGRPVLALDYRLAPQARYPDWRDDALAAYTGLEEEGYPASQIVLAGDSAGGHLVLACLLQLKALQRSLPAAAVLLSPWTDMHCASASMRLLAPFDAMLDAQALRALGQYHARGHDMNEPGLSPLYADPQGLPPCLVQVSDHEIFLDDALQWADRARAAGVTVETQIWPGMIHVFQLFCRWMPEAAEAVKDIAAFIKTHLPT